MHNGTAGRHPLAEAIERVVDEPVGGRARALLIELPLRLCDDRFGRRDLSLLRSDLLRAARQTRYFHLIRKLPHLRRRRLCIRARIVELRFCNAARAVLRFVASELQRRLARVRRSLGELRAIDVDFGYALAGLNVGELRAGRRELLLRLPQRGRFRPLNPVRKETRPLLRFDRARPATA